MRQRLNGYTLIEILIVMAILVVLGALVFASLSGVREKARQSGCTSNLRQIGMAMKMYAQDYEGIEPTVGMHLTRESLGLPPYVTALYFNYLKDEQVLFCPNYHGPFGKAGAMGGSYVYAAGGDESIYPDPQYKYSNVIALKGGTTPLLYDEWHNPPIETKDWKTNLPKTILILRLNQQIETRTVTVNTDYFNF